MNLAYAWIQRPRLLMGLPVMRPVGATDVMQDIGKRHCCASNTGCQWRLFSLTVAAIISIINPSNAEGYLFGNHLELVMLVFIGWIQRPRLLMALPVMRPVGATDVMDDIGKRHCCATKTGSQ